MKYRDLEKLGSGGFGVVWKVVRVEDGKNFAKKVLLDSPDLTQEDKDRFSAEARLLKSLNHPRIVKVIATHLSTEPFWFILPLYQGSLREIIPKVHADPELAAKVIGQLLDAVENAHMDGVIHRDLKPENILYDAQGDIVVSDFGLGRQLNSESTRKTFTGQQLGTPYYMAPEQLTDAKSATALSDIYAIGRIIYELATGDLPHLQPDLKGMDPGLAHVISKCTSRRPEDRYQSIAELRRDYLLVAQGQVGKKSGDDLDEILAGLVGTPLDASSLKQLHEALMENRDNADKLHEALMAIPAEAFQRYSEAYPEAARELLRKFSEHVEKTGWGFDACDEIANVILRLRKATEDVPSRVNLSMALLELGFSHNRWYVMGKFRDHLTKLESPGEILALRDALAKAPHRMATMKESLLATNIPDILKKFLRALD